MNDPVLTLLGFLLVFAVLGVAEGVRRTGKMGEEGTRKLVHIGVGHWILFAPAIRDIRWAVVAPIAFILLNYLSYRKGVFSAMERSDKHTGLGTVYYSMALTVVVLLFFGDAAAWFSADGPLRWAAVAGILTMAWGDGLAAVVGERWGRHPYTLTGPRKSVEGSLAMFLATAVVLFVCVRYAGVEVGTVSVLGVALVATVLEAGSPAGTDNLSVPIATAVLVAMLA